MSGLRMSGEPMDRPHPAGTRPATLFFLFVVGYFAVQTLLRIVLAPSVGLDEAEILVTAQFPAWGHGSQPPLYNWLQIGVLHLFGINLFALAVLKNTLLALGFVFLFLSGRIVFRDDAKAALGALGLFLLPDIGWESQRALTHSVIAITLVTATLWALLRMLRSGRLADYILLGIAIGLGGMTKYNYVIALAAMLAAALSVRDLRARLLAPGILATFLAAGLVFLPHGLWLLDHAGLALSRTHKFEARADAAFTPEPVFVLLVSFALAVALVLVVFLAVAGLSWWRNARPHAQTLSPERRLILRIVPAGLLLLAIGAFVTGTTEIRGRWLVPLTVFVPLALLVLLEGAFGPRQRRAVAISSLVCAGLAMAALGVLHIVPDVIRTPPEANRPFPEIAAGLRREGFNGGVILAAKTRLAGALKLEFPDSLALSLEYGADAPPPAGADVLVVWENRAEMPQDLRDLLAHMCGLTAPPEEPRLFSLPFLRSEKRIALYAARPGSCRADP